MIVVMKPGVSQETIREIARRVEELGLKAHVIHGTDLTVVAVIGDDRKKNGTVLEQAPGHGYDLVDREPRPALNG